MKILLMPAAGRLMREKTGKIAGFCAVLGRFMVRGSLTQAGDHTRDLIELTQGKRIGHA